MPADAETLHSHHDRLRHPDGSWKYTNALSHETSPYLLQHAHNPVQWHAWKDEAFELARQVQKPIFLSIGYSTCYWCHVMERQSFEDPDIAAVMNEHFVNIKVDREERPDVDDVYMTATQLMTGHGGWPMSVFLTPPPATQEPGARRGLLPFYCGTYFPPRPMHGRPGFPQLLEALAKTWREQPQDVHDQAERVAAAVKQQLEHAPAAQPAPPLQVDTVQQAVDQLLRMYDPQHGGFGQAPKFPTPVYLQFLLRVHRNNPEPSLWQAIHHTLDRMARGGIYDQIGGGFHRYSVDGHWLVPHFEKMLYDNGQLVWVYAEAHDRSSHLSEREVYERVIRETCDYVLRDMTDATGAFWSAQDAEVDAREGGNYVWTRQQVEDAIDDPSLRSIALRLYGLNDGPNFQDPHHPDAHPVNVLYLPTPVAEAARELGVERDEIDRLRRQINGRLKEVRDDRDQPATDDKVLTAWNGLMIGGLARAARALDEPRFAEVAALAANAILKHMSIPGEQHCLYRSMRAGRAKIPAFLEDYAFFIHGLIELHRAMPGQEGDRWLERAQALMQTAINQFAAPGGGYFDTLDDDRTRAELFVRTRSMHDGALPSGNSQMIHNLLDLHELTDEDVHLLRATRDLRRCTSVMQRSGAGAAHMQHALLRVLEVAPAEVKTDSPRDDDPPAPVEVTAEPVALSLHAGESGKLTVRLRIAAPFHLNGHAPRVSGLIATDLRLDGEGAELEVAYPEPRVRQFPFADEPLEVYEGEITLQAVIRRIADHGEPRLMLRYQPCDDAACQAPRDVQVPVRITFID